MELVTCANCRSVYGDLQDECPHCGADHSGEGAEVEFDGATRTAIASLGGVFGGILSGPYLAGTGSTHALWCARGVCLYSETCGLLWFTAVRGKVEELSVRQETLEVIASGRSVTLLAEDGSEPES